MISSQSANLITVAATLKRGKCVVICLAPRFFLKFMFAQSPLYFMDPRRKGEDIILINYMKYLVILILFSSFSFCEEPNLPFKAEELLRKLDSWKVQKQEELDQEIKDKEEVVIKLLEKQIEVAAQSKNLEAITALREAVKELKGGSSQPDESGQKPYEKPNLSRHDNVVEYLVGSHWTLFQSADFIGKSETVVFQDEGKAKVGDETVSWALSKETGKVWINESGSNAGVILKFSDEDAKGLVGGMADNMGIGRSMTRK